MIFSALSMDMVRIASARTRGFGSSVSCGCEKERGERVDAAKLFEMTYLDKGIDG